MAYSCPSVQWGKTRNNTPGSCEGHVCWHVARVGSSEMTGKVIVFSSANAHHSYSAGTVCSAAGRGSKVARLCGCTWKADPYLAPSGHSAFKYKYESPRATKIKNYANF